MMAEFKFMKENRLPLLIITIELIVIIIFSSFLVFSILNQSENVPETQVGTPTPTKVSLEPSLTGWFAAWDSNLAIEEIPSVIKYFDTFSPMLYRVMPDSSLGDHRLSNRNFILNQARENGIPLAPVITDESDYARIEKLLRSKTHQKLFGETCR